MNVSSFDRSSYFVCTGNFPSNLTNSWTVGRETSNEWYKYSRSLSLSRWIVQSGIMNSFIVHYGLQHPTCNGCINIKPQPKKARLTIFRPKQRDIILKDWKREKLLNLTRIGTQLHRLWLCISFMRVLLIATLSMDELGAITLILFKNYQRMFLWVIENYTLPLPTQFSSCRTLFYSWDPFVYQNVMTSHFFICCFFLLFYSKKMGWSIQLLMR